MVEFDYPTAHGIVALKNGRLVIARDGGYFESDNIVSASHTTPPPRDRDRFFRTPETVETFFEL